LDDSGDNRPSEPRAAPFAWQARASCRDYPPETFFTDGLNGARQRASEEFAKQVCRGCPVIAACADYALNAPEPYGVWGAMTPREGATQRRRRGLKYVGR
jgi:WhiB family redox-sensing transcriptional regulator